MTGASMCRHKSVGGWGDGSPSAYHSLRPVLVGQLRTSVRILGVLMEPPFWKGGASGKGCGLRKHPLL